MKYKVKIEKRIFEVEIGDLHSQPVLANVDGETIEVWVERSSSTAGVPTVSPTGGQKVSIPIRNSPSHMSQPEAMPASSGSTQTGLSVTSNEVHSPIPGVIVSVAVKTGDEVEVGQELCVLEAMKMKNAIRAPKAGQMANVLVTTGQTVKHHDVLMEYSA